MPSAVGMPQGSMGSAVISPKSKRTKFMSTGLRKNRSLALS